MSETTLWQQPEVTDEMIREHGLSDDERQVMLDILGRQPTYTELGIFSVMWSEHCSYKSSRVHLGKFPTEGERVLQGPGENAGVIDIGDGLAVCFKMESHNHPSFIEPYQGAATGVGGILRDVFTMGARPIANMNTLRFGSPHADRMGYLIRGVVKGIGDYGNCIGVPTVAGDVFFHPSYNGNILVNAFTLGIMPSDRIFRGNAEGVGNPVMYVGSKTGKDGIHGATMASEEFSEENEEKRPTVQVGDPFTEKLLLEACLELMAQDHIVGIQDMGAAGLTSSSFEMADRSGSGIIMHLDRVPMREQGMTPYEVLLSESQERMLIVAKKGHEKDVAEIFYKWDLEAVVVGEVCDDGHATIMWHGEQVARIPVAPIATKAPKYDRPQEDLAPRPALNENDIPMPVDLAQTAYELIGSPNLCSRKWVWTQYDSTVRTNTMTGPGAGDAAVVRIKGTKKAIAVKSDVNPRHVDFDPYVGGMMTVAEAARNVVCVGAEPLGITDCLNYGNPEKPHVMRQFALSIDGISEACRVLGTPVVSGNVSFYNDTDGESILPTPSIGMVGLIEDVEKTVGSHFCKAGDEIILLGENRPGMGGSEYLSFCHNNENGQLPSFNLEEEKCLQKSTLKLIRSGLVKSAHDVSDGGLLVNLLESCFADDHTYGAEVDLPGDFREDAILFGESPSRIVLSCDTKDTGALLDKAHAMGMEATHVGVVLNAQHIHAKVYGQDIEVDTKRARSAWETGFSRLLGE